MMSALSNKAKALCHRRVLCHRWHRASALSILFCIAAVGCSKPATEEVATETVVPVTTEAAATGSIRAVISATGDVNPAAGAEMVVVAPEPARILEITKAEGDPVRRGDVLVRFDIPTLGADVQAKGAEVTGAEERLRLARENLTRLQDLFTRGVAARKEVEDASKEVSDAQAALTQAQAGRGSAQQLAARTTVTATFNGVIAKRMHNPGDLVEAAASDPVLRVIDPTRLQVDASVPIADLSRIKVGASARVMVADDQPPIPMKVASRPAAVEPGTASAPIRLSFVSVANLAVGTPVQTEIDAEEHAGVVLVPAEALVHEGDETAVFVAVANKAQRRVVEVGIADKDHAEIKSGVKAGEQVITHGQAGLPDGAAISTEKPAAEKPGAEKPTPSK
jgi:RND family efflux transporter MFP subunit